MITDPNSNTTTFTYDAAYHNQLTSIADPLGNSFSRGYDSMGRFASVTDAKGKSATYTYDLMDHMASVTDPNGASTRYAYDPSGNLVLVLDPKGNGIQYEYDNRNRITKMTDQQGRYETYAYYTGAEIPTHGDNLKSITDRKGQTTTFNTYDPMNRLTKVTYNDGSYTQYAYDAVGRVTNINDTTSGVIGYTYSDYGCGSCSGNGVDKVAQELTPLGTINYTYDKLGRRATMLVTNGSAEPTVTYTYDDASRLTKLNRSVNGTSRDYLLAYDLGGRRTSLKLPLYKSQGTWKYDTTTYGYNAASQLLSMLQQGPSAQIENLVYTYDANGNRVTAQRNATIPMANAISGTSYDATNEMLAYNSKNLVYDTNGNLTSNGTNTYTWDARNRLTGISGAVTASFSYDALNRRISKTINGTTTQYIYDGVDIVQEVKSGVKTNYVRTLNIDEPLTRITGTTVRHYVTDGLPSIIALTDDTGVVKTTYTYDAYGNTTVSGEASDNPFQYTRRENDGTGLYYYRARYYSPEMQRFVSEDPIRLKAGINFYAYVENNAINRIDPEGLFWDQYPMNGNTLPIPFKRQDDLCSWPAPQRWNQCPDKLKCCKEHDACYTRFHCNWSSWIWLNNIPGPCQWCNLKVVWCISNTL